MSCGPFVTVPFSAAVRDCTGGNPKVQRKDYLSEGDLPVIDQGQEFIAGFTDAKNVYCGKLPVVVFGDHTRTLKYVDFPFALGADGVKVLEPLEGFDAAFLCLYFRSVNLPSAGYSRHFKFLKELAVPKPTLPEQHRLVDILSRAEGIVRLRREAEKKAAELIPALFIDLFGDPATNPRGWPVERLEDVAQIISGVTKGRRLEATECVELPYMRVGNVKDGYLDLSEVKTIAVRPAEVEKYRLHPGDLLLTEGGDPDKLGRGALWAGEIETCLHQNHIFKVRAKRELVQPEYLAELTGSAYGKAYFFRIAKKTTGIASINRTQLGGFPIPLPPPALQTDFIDKLAAIRSIQSQQSAATAKAQASFDALLAEAFGG